MMPCRARWAGFLAALWLALLPPVAGAEVPVPALKARVTDLTATLDATQQAHLDSLLAGIESTRGAQLAILLLPSVQPETMEQFGIRLAGAWKIGHKGKDDGLIIIVAKNDRKMRIEVGYGLEGVIPDAVAKRIVAERMGPRFKQGDFAGGLVAAVEAVDAALGGSGEFAPQAAAQSQSAAEERDWTPWLFGLLFVAGILRSLFGIFGSVIASAVGAWLAFSMFGSMIAAIIAAVIVFVFSFGRFGSGGGGWSSGGGGFSSGGGFSGGGGSFGGGGASGDW